jgi:non-ribosomal peptide synthetase component E (peptide arylation enzyme)
MTILTGTVCRHVDNFSFVSEMILKQIAARAQKAPDATAVIVNGSRISYAGFLSSIVSARRFFEQTSLDDDVLAVICTSSILKRWLCCLALRSLGISTAVIGPVRISEIKQHQKGAQFICDQKSRSNPRLKDILERPIIIPDGFAASSDLVPSLEHSDFLTKRMGDHFLLTSGSTGIRKMVRLEARFEDERNKETIETWSFSSDTVFFALNFPLDTSVGFSKSLSVWSAGGTVVIDQRLNRFDQAFLLPITDMIIVPMMIPEYMAAFARCGAHKANFTLYVGGGFLSFEGGQTLARTVVNPVDVYYASTEVPARMLRSKFDSLDSLLWLKTTGARRIEIVDERDVECPPDVEGELRIRRENFDVSQYWNGVEEDMHRFRDGYFYPGDMAVKRADGRVRILGRASEVLNLNGVKIAVGPVEQKIKELSHAEDICVFSSTNAEGLIELVVAAQIAEPLSDTLKDAIVSCFPWCERVRFYCTTQFPHKDVGHQKIDRMRLKKMLT